MKIFISLSISMLLLATNLYADTFNLDYTLTEGGYRLELDAANAYKGVKIAVSSDVATRYEIIQRIITPLENRNDPTKMISENFVVRGLRGTNQFGNFRMPAEDIPVRNDEPVYVSDTSGADDSFTLVYGISGIENIAAGDYFGRVSFTLNPISSTRSPITKILDVYVTVSKELEIQPSVEIIPLASLSTITLNSQKEEGQTFDVQVKINGPFKSQFTISQLMPQPLESSEGNRMEDAAINFQTKEVSKGMGVGTLALTTQKQTIYTSGPNGEAAQSFLITYSLGDLSNYKAGRYTSRIQYILEETGKTSLLKTLEVEVENGRIFDLVITPEEQRSRIEFQGLKPNEPPKKSEMTIAIVTNISKPYQVSQNVLSELTDAEGNVIPFEYFTIKTESLETKTKGKLKFLEKENVKKDDTVLFVSDAQGSSDKFKAVYELTCPPELRAGDYSTRITYSLLEI